MNIVKIPDSLVEKMQPFGPRYLKIEKPILGDPHSGKAAFEKNWQNKLYNHQDLELQQWLADGGNYGIVAGEGIIEIDLDTKEMVAKFRAKVRTFEVKSGRPDNEGLHAYCRSDIKENGSINISINNNEEENIGNIQTHHKYLVGPNSNHFSGGTYEILNDLPLAWVTKETFTEIFGKTLTWAGERKKETEEQAQDERNRLGDSNIPIREIIPDFNKLRQTSANEFQGSHPIHGSMTGQNFTVNDEKNCWHCFRHNSGGGPLMWLAVKNGLIPCEKAQKGALRGTLFLETLELAKKEGYEIDNTMEPEVAKYFEDGQFVPYNLAIELMEKYHYITRRKDKIIFVYHEDTGTYTPDGEEHIMEESVNALGKHLRKNRLSEVINFIICSTMSKMQTIQETPPHLIPMKNGIYNFKTKDFENFTPNYFILNAIPITYKPFTDCLIWKKYLNQTVTPEDILPLQEFFGYCMWRGYPFQRALMLIGGGANGKSVFLNVAGAFLGGENKTAIDLRDFTNQFERAILFGKLANIYPDISDVALRDTGKFKMLTDGSVIHAAFKFHDGFDYVNYAKFLFSCNKIPETPDDTDAFFRRWVIINFPNQFPEGGPNTDPFLTDKLTTDEELSGIFNWALEGLFRLFQYKKFSTGKTVEDTREQYYQASDSAKSFIDKHVEQESGKYPLKDDVYKSYLAYCQKWKLPSIPKNAFSMKFSQFVPWTSTIRKTIDKQKVVCWTDVSVTFEADNQAQECQKGIKGQSSLLRENLKSSNDKNISNNDTLSFSPLPSTEPAPTVSFGEALDRGEEKEMEG